MGKKHRAGTGSTPSPDNDKPDWAAELFRGDSTGNSRGDSKRPAKSGNQIAPQSDQELRLSDRLGAKTLDQLAKLKQQMSNNQVPTSAGDTAANRGVPRKPTTAARPNLDEQTEPSFAELFNSGTAAEDESFGDLLDKSKLDWRAHK